MIWKNLGDYLQDVKFDAVFYKRFKTCQRYLQDYHVTQPLSKANQLSTLAA